MLSAGQPERNEINSHLSAAASRRLPLPAGEVFGGSPSHINDQPSLALHNPLPVAESIR
jgi:hypothetical protein